jgi:hypothetical protein
MIAYLLKNWKLLLDIILVVAAIVAFSILDPFKIMSKSTTRSTANLVSSIKGIGEMVTAEYFGEVIASLYESRVYDIPEDTLYEEFENCFTDLKHVVANAILQHEEKKVLFVFKPQAANRVLASPKFDSLDILYPKNIFDHLLVFIAHHNIDEDVEKFYDFKNKQLKGSTAKKVVQFLADEMEAYGNRKSGASDAIMSSHLKDYIFSTPSYFTSVSEFHYMLNREQLDKRKTRKKDIVFIGRGWVKAGYKFDRLDERNFFYDRSQKRVTFYGLSPVVLDKDINPWFIPEKRIKGFELVDYYKNATFEEAKQVKTRCKEKLLEQARLAGILEQAQANGEEALREFLVLLLDEPQLRVEFVDFPFQNLYTMIAADTLVTVQEALAIDSVYRYEISNLADLTPFERERKLQRLTLFFKNLETLDFVEKGQPFNFYSLEASKILEHRLLVTKKDFEKMKEVRGNLVRHLGQLSTPYMDTHPYFLSHPGFIQDFNSTLKILEKQVAQVDVFWNDTIHAQSNHRDIIIGNPQLTVVDSTLRGNGEYHYHVTHTLKNRDFNFNDLRYIDYSLRPESFDSLKIRDTVFVDALVQAQLKPHMFEVGIQGIDSLIRSDSAAIHAFESHNIKQGIKVRPVEKLTRFVQKIVN